MTNAEGITSPNTTALLSEIVQIINEGFKYTNIPDEEEYDFIIIGSGSAGSVMASRLSEIPKWKILLLETGRPENEFSKTPIFTPFLQFTDYNWGYSTQPTQTACLALVNQKCLWPRGKALGGTSAINFMIYARGNPEDYKRWADLGNLGWSYEDVLPYFLKSEDAGLNNADPRFHRSGGYLYVTNTFQSELANTFFKAGKELGYEKIDSNTPNQIGFSEIYATIKNGQRLSAANAYLNPVKERPNLKILTGARVTKVLINPITKEATGVQYMWNDRKIKARAKKEVILSAGVFNSPQLLMLSGIGPQLDLWELGILPIQNSPVGQTIYDHVIYSGMVLLVNTSHSFNLAEYVLQTKDLPRIPLVEAIGFIATNISKNKNYPDIEIHLIPTTFATDLGQAGRRVMGLSDDYYKKMYSEIEDETSIAILPKLLHPQSRGYLKLQSSDPYKYPLFYPNYFTDHNNIDKKTLIAGIRFVQKLCKAEAFKKYNLQIFSKPVLGCETLKYDSDEYWGCAIKFLSTSGFSQTSTCKMGPPYDPTAVVDSNLKVYGIKRLRVVDSSVIPIPLSAHLNAVTMMISEKAADLIKGEWHM